MRVVIIGGSGHVGTYLVPRLVEAGHEVLNVSRGQGQPYHAHRAWERVQPVPLDRRGMAPASFAAQVAELDPDAVIDMICFDLQSCEALVAALCGRVQHFLFCGTIWMLGPSEVVPTTEEHPRRSFGEYGTQKAACERFLHDEARRGRFPASCVHPGSITGPGYLPVSPLGNYDPHVFELLAAGEELLVPSLGMETLHHVHADDVAQMFMLCLANWSASVGQSFWAVSPQALTLRGYAQAVAGWWSREARLRCVPFEQWKGTVSERHAETTWGHLLRSSSLSIAKAQRLLGYQPRYSSLQALYECVASLVALGIVQAPPLGTGAG
jgi:nucleoside-diphosphate-sugar epimerase